MSVLQSVQILSQESWHKHKSSDIKTECIYYRNKELSGSTATLNSGKQTNQAVGKSMKPQLNEQNRKGSQLTEMTPEGNGQREEWGRSLDGRVRETLRN